MENSRKRIFRGKVAKVYQNTIIVEVLTSKKHPLYGKTYIQTKKYPAHAEPGTVGVGDTVSIIETRPISKTKKFRLDKVIEKAVI